MRYRETGNVHLDFHGATNTTIDYIVDNYGIDALKEILFRVGRDVYKDIRENLAKGNPEELVKFWEYFLSREEGDFTIEKQGDEIILEIESCPAVNHVKRLGLPLSPHFCKQTEFLNCGLCEGTPYSIETEKTGENSCRQILKRKP